MKELNFRGILILLRKYLAVILALTVLFGAAGFSIATWVIKPVYQASAMLVVQAESSSVQTTSDDVFLSQQLADTYAVVLKSDGFVSQVIANLHLNTDKDSLKNSIQLSSVGATQVMQLRVRNGSPAMARSIAKEIVRLAPEQIAGTISVGRVKVASPVMRDPNPVSPNVPMATGFAAALGLVLSLVFIGIRESLNTTFKTDEEIRQRLGLEVIGVIPRVSTKTRPEFRAAHRKNGAPS